MPAKQASKPDLLIVAFDLVAERGWAGLSPVALADRAGLPLVDVYRQLPDRPAVLRRLSERVDEAMLGIDRSELAGLPARDQLFELTMRRLDGLAPFRAGLMRLMADARRDPCLLLLTGCRLDRSLRWMQELAGLRARGLRARLQRRALMAVYVQALCAWLADDSADLAKTMAELDTLLRRFERFVGLTGPRAQPRSNEAAEPA
jgi:AcrR family transcriptional regulator